MKRPIARWLEHVDAPATDVLFGGCLAVFVLTGAWSVLIVGTLAALASAFDHGWWRGTERSRAHDLYDNGGHSAGGGA